MLHPGSGPTDRDGNNMMMRNDSLKLLSQGLLGEGIASLRIDKRGIAASASAGLSEADLRFDHYAADAAAWLRFLNQDKRFSKLIFVGHSEGSLVGAVAVTKFEAPVDGVISLAGAGFPAADVLRKQMGERLPPELNEISNEILASLERGETVAEPAAALNMLYRESVQPYMISWFQYDPAKVYAQIQQPTLVLNGTTDIQVSEDDARRIAEVSGHKLRLISGMNHVLKEVHGDLQAQLPSYSDPSIPLHPALIGVIAEFVEQVALPSG